MDYLLLKKIYKMKKYSPLLVIALVFFACKREQKVEYHYPQTKKSDQADNYFGTQVADPYRWLEDDNSEETKQWVDAQNKVTFDYLATIPYREKIRQRLENIWNYPKYSAPFRAGENYFFYKNDGLQNQSVLYIQKGLDGIPEVFLDPNTLSEDGTAALTFTRASKDGKYLGYGVAQAGSDWQEFFVMDIATKEKTNDHIQHIKFSGMSWYKDGFFYTRYPKPEEGKELSSQNEYSQVFYHKIGTTQDADKLIYEDNEHPKRGKGVWATEDEKYLLLALSEGATNNNALYFKEAGKKDASFKPIVERIENSYDVIDNIGDKLLVATNKNAPKYKVVLIDPKNPSEENWQVIIPEKEEVLNNISAAGGKLFAEYMKDVSSRIYVYDMKGNLQNEVTLPTLGNAGGFGGKKEDTIVFYNFTSYIYPSTIFKYNIRTQESSVFHKSEIDFDPEKYETKQVFFSSKDGERIPMFITHKKGLTLDGNNPTLLYGYGGFNISVSPSFSTSKIILLENGGVYAVVTLRGGSEYGEEWHKAGMLLNKQNVFNDFIGAAEYLINKKYTSSEKLAISGRSNGGLLVGATMTQRPDLFKVALPAVGVMDMLRFHKFTIGHAWVPEYGSSEDSVQFYNLYSYSPVHNIKEGVGYPATLVTTADHDDRVVPAHSYKFIATLQEKHQGNNPVMIRIESKAGHGSGKPTSKIIEEEADIWAFVFKNLGVEIKY